jgi:hypothetical protein
VSFFHRQTEGFEYIRPGVGAQTIEYQLPTYLVLVRGIGCRQQRDDAAAADVHTTLRPVNLLDLSPVHGSPTPISYFLNQALCPDSRPQACPSPGRTGRNPPLKAGAPSSVLSLVLVIGRPDRVLLLPAPLHVGIIKLGGRLLWARKAPQVSKAHRPLGLIDPLHEILATHLRRADASAFTQDKRSSARPYDTAVLGSAGTS